MTIHGEDSKLTARLRDLAQTDEGVEAPARVEQTLLAHWDRTRARSALIGQSGSPFRDWLIRRRGWRQGVAIAGAAALLILGVTIASRVPISMPARRGPAEVATSVGMLPPSRTAPDTWAALSETEPEPARQHSRRPAPSRRPPPDLRDAPSAGDVAVFVPLGPMTEQERDDSFQVVRVRLSRSALIGFGVPIDENHAAEPLQADVLLGEDGFARGIRFVRN